MLTAERGNPNVVGRNWSSGSLEFGSNSSGFAVSIALGVDAGYPLPGKIRQAQFVLPGTTDWKGLKLRAEVEVKGMRYPVRWACHQKLNDDGSLTLRPNLRQQV